MAKNKKIKIMIFFIFLKKKFTPLSFLYGISTLKGFPRQKTILTTYMHFILSKKHDLSDFEKNRKCPHGNAVWGGGEFYPPWREILFFKMETRLKHHETPWLSQLYPTGAIGTIFSKFLGVRGM